ncbi:MAG: cation:proton antiporter [Cypionkella sp.]|nr:cation:proton antiporter [Cypionkella sp.]
MESLLLQASIYLGAAVIVVPLALRYGLGSVLGYIVAGILMAPILRQIGADAGEVQHIAEFGVVLMLFLIGLELEPETLWKMRGKLLGMGGAQILATTLAVSYALWGLGVIWSSAVVLGLLMSLSSTAIVLQSLSEKNLMRTAGGRSAFSVLLTQDIALIPILALVPLMALPAIQGPQAQQFGITNADAGELDSAGSAAPLISLVQSLPDWAAAALTLAIVAGIVLAGHYLSRPIFRYVHAAKLPEMSTFISLLMVLGIAFLMILVGLSPALGTFVAGVVLANSEFRHQLEADLRPFKGLLMGLFFMTVGVGIDFDILFHQPFTVLGLTLGLIALKAVILLIIALVARLRGQDRWLFTLSLAQGGEFGFVIIAFARSEGSISLAHGKMALLVISLSMLLTPFLFIAYDYLAKRIKSVKPSLAADEINEQGAVIIAGIGRFGQVVNRLVRGSGLSTVVLDNDMATVDAMRRFDIKGFYGDPSRPELLEAAGLATAQVVVVAVDDRDVALNIVRFVRGRRSDIHIVARARDRVHVYELFQAGANDIVRETFDSSVRAGRYVLENMGFSEYEASKASQTFARVDRAAMRDLAQLWVPGQPSHLNEAYILRARELEKDIASALTNELHELRILPDETDSAETKDENVVPAFSIAEGDEAASERDDTAGDASPEAPSKA